MKAKLILSVFFSILCYSAFSQVPQGFNYDALAFGSDGNPLKNTTIKVKLSILSDTNGFKSSGSGTYIWEEEFTGVVTNSHGGFSVPLGTGARVQGNVTYFYQIDWTSGIKYVGIKIANPTTYLNMGTSRLWSVPYAMVADSLSGPVKKLAVSGTTTDYTEALFEVKNKDGQTVFAVYNEGVRIYVDNGVPGKAVKGGFAIGSFNKAKGYNDYFVVTGDSIRAYIDTGIVKARKGGFAIGSFNRAKAGYEEYLRITRDSARINIDNSTSKATKGGFAIGSFNASKTLIPKYLTVNPNRTNVSVNDSTKGFSITSIQGGTAADFMNINKINYAIGHESGLKLTPNFSAFYGRYNVFFGYHAGFNATTAYGNLFCGHETGYSTVTGSYNVFLGYQSGKTNSAGLSNVYIGYQSGQASNTSYNVYIGQGSGMSNSVGARNTYLGSQSGIEDGLYFVPPSTYTPGSDNVFLGYRSGAQSWIGNQNVYVGTQTGENTYGTGRIFIGYQAGRNESTDNKLYIDNSSVSSPLIWGDFTANIIKINGDLQYTGALTHISDIRLKTNLSRIPSTLSSLLNINAYTFNWKENIIPDLEMSREKQVGVIAQEIEKYFPEIVKTGADGFKSVDYTMFAALMLPAIRELNDMIQEKNSEINMLKQELKTLKEQVEDIQKQVNQKQKDN